LYGNNLFDPNGAFIDTWASSAGSSGTYVSTWTLDDVNAIAYVSASTRPLFMSKGGIITSFRNNGAADPCLGYRFLVKKTNQVITPAEIAGTYQVRFLETGPGGVPYTCAQGTCIIRADGTISLDAYFSDGEHNVFNSTYTLGPGNTFSTAGIPEQGIISSDKNLMFMPEYVCSNPRNSYDWIGGIFLVRTPVKKNADLTGDCTVNFIDFALFAEWWLADCSVSNNWCDGGDIDSSGNVNIDDLQEFSIQWLNNKIISEHVFGIEISTEWGYWSPGVSDDEYVLDIEIYTDEMVDRIEFKTPAGNTFEIPNSPITGYAIAGGYLEKGREFNDEHGQYMWLYEPRFVSPDSLSAYGDGLYTFTIYYMNGCSQQTTAWFGIPGTTDPIPQPTQIPIFTSFDNGDTVTSPVTLTWQACTDPAASSIEFYLSHESGEEMEFNLPVSATGLDEPLEMTAGLWEDVELGFERNYWSQNSDGITIFAGKGSESDYYLTVE
jgi:hypothetical protein